MCDRKNLVYQGGKERYGRLSYVWVRALCPMEQQEIFRDSSLGEMLVHHRVPLEPNSNISKRRKKSENPT